jgi:Domain of unknown function (DUF4349)
VPSTQFTSLLGDLTKLGTLQSQQLNAEDVSAEYIDTDARIRNLQRTEGELLKLLTRTGGLKDILAVEREVARVRGEIEQAQGRIRYLAHQVNLATIDLTLSAKVQTAEVSPWNLAPALKNAWEDTQTRLSGKVAEFLAFLVDIVAYRLVLGVPIALLYFLLGRWGEGRIQFRYYRQLWWAGAIALLGLTFPPLILGLVLVGGTFGVLWLGQLLWQRFKPQATVQQIDVN